MLTSTINYSQDAGLMTKSTAIKARQADDVVCMNGLAVKLFLLHYLFIFTLKVSPAASSGTGQKE